MPFSSGTSTLRVGDVRGAETIEMQRSGVAERGDFGGYTPGSRDITRQMTNLLANTLAGPVASSVHPAEHGSKGTYSLGG